MVKLQESTRSILGVRSKWWLWLVALLTAAAGVLVFAQPAGECGRFSEWGATFIHFGGFTPESGNQTAEEAAELYATELLGGSGYTLQLEDEDAAEPMYRALSDDGDLLAWFSVSKTQYGRYFVGGHEYCVDAFKEFTGVES